MLSELKIISTADWHLGHKRIPTIDTISNIRKLILPRLREVDMLVIAGDIFDGRVALDNPDTNLTMSLFADILVRCYEEDVVFRVLQGTFTHDLHQLEFITQLYRKLALPVNYRLFRSLDVEYIPSLSTSILYVPDNLPFKHKHEALSRINDLLLTNQMKQVDYVVLHGEFDNTLYGKFMHNAFSLSEFDPICRHRILAGHVHSSQQHGKLLYAGSINRLNHGEEEAKGFWIVTGNEAEFIENTDAVKFVTIDYTDEGDIDKLLERHCRLMLNIQSSTESHVRIIISDPHLKQTLRSYHCSNFPSIKLSFKNKAVDKKGDLFLDEKLKAKQAEILETPSIENLPKLICNHLLNSSVNITHSDVVRILEGTL